MKKTSKAIPAAERLRRAKAEIDLALALPEPTEARARYAWIKKRRSCVWRADQELLFARRAGASEADIKRINDQIDKVWESTNLRRGQF